MKQNHLNQNEFKRLTKYTQLLIDRTKIFYDFH